MYEGAVRAMYLLMIEFRCELVDIQRIVVARHHQCCMSHASDRARHAQAAVGCTATDVTGKKQQVLMLVADLVDIDTIPLGVEVADDPQSELVAIGFDYSVHGP